MLAAIASMAAGAMHLVGFLAHRDDGIALAAVWIFAGFVWFMTAIRDRYKFVIAEGRAFDKMRHLKVMFVGSMLVTLLGILAIPIVFVFSQSEFDYIGVVLLPIMLGMVWIGYRKYRDEIRQDADDER